MHLSNPSFFSSHAAPFFPSSSPSSVLLLLPSCPSSQSRHLIPIRGHNQECSPLFLFLLFPITSALRRVKDSPRINCNTSLRVFLLPFFSSPLPLVANPHFVGLFSPLSEGSRQGKHPFLLFIFIYLFFFSFTSLPHYIVLIFFFLSSLFSLLSLFYLLSFSGYRSASPVPQDHW